MMFYKFFERNTSGGAVKSKIIPNQELAEELHKPIIKKIQKCKVYLSFNDNILGRDPAYINR